MGTVRMQMLIQRYKEIDEELEMMYRKQDVLHGNAHLFGISIPKPNKMLYLENRLEQIVEAIVADRPAETGFHTMQECLVDWVKETMF